MERGYRSIWAILVAALVICLTLIAPQFSYAQEAPTSPDVDQPEQAGQIDADASIAAGTLTWNTFAGSASADYPGRGVVDASGNIYLAGISSSTWGSPVRGFSGPNEAVVLKYDSNGVLLWHSFLGSTSTDVAFDLAVDTSGRVYVVGSSWLAWGSPVRSFTTHPSELRPDIFVARLSSTGVLEWLTFLGGTGNDRDGAITLNGSDVYVSGTSSAAWGSPNRAFAGGSDIFVARLNSFGALQWHTFLGSSGGDDVAGDLVSVSNDVYVVGSSPTTWGSPVVAHHGGLDATVARLNTSGTFIWNTFVGGAGDEEGLALTTYSSSGVVLGGSSTATWGNTPYNRFNGGKDGMIAQVNPQGTVPWNTFLGSPVNDVINDVAEDSNGNFLFVGTSDQGWGAPVNAYTGATEAVVGKLNSSGYIQWNSFLGSTSFDEGKGVAALSAGRVAVFGQSYKSWGTPIRAYTAREEIFAALLPDFGSRTGQSITFPTLADRTVGDPPVTLNATATSGLPVTYAASGSCTVQGNSVSFAVAGYCTVVANQEGSQTYAPAIDQVRGFLVSKGNQTITFASLANRDYDLQPFTISASASSGLPVSFTSTTPTKCSTFNNTVNMVAAGTCTIVASQAGNAGYNPAADVSRSFTIAVANQTITFAPIADKTFGDLPFGVGPFASSGLFVSLASTTPTRCTTINNLGISLLSAGTCTIVASQPGFAGKYNPAPNVSRSFTIAKANQTINFAALPNKTIGNAPFGVSATATSGLPVSFASTTAAKCTVASGTVTLVAVGTCTIVASQAGNGNYNAAANVSRSFDIAKANQTINFAALSNKTIGSPPFALSASATSGLAVSFTSTTAPVCTVAGTTVTLVKEGTCTIRAQQAGNANYNAAPTIDRSFAVQPSNAVEYKILLPTIKR